MMVHSLQDNDIFAVINGVPAMILCLYGFLTPGVPGGLCFGAGLGITLFGIMCVHFIGSFSGSLVRLRSDEDL